jgi:hypothetical protein
VTDRRHHLATIAAILMGVALLVARLTGVWS